MAKLFSPSLEGIALRSMLSKNRQISGKLLSSLDSTYFNTEQAKEALDLLKEDFLSHGKLPSFRLLCEAQELSEDTRDFLREAGDPVKTIESAEELCDKLFNYRQARTLYLMAKETLQTLEKPKVDMGKLVMKAADRLTMAQQRVTRGADILHIGSDSNMRDTLETMLFEKDDNAVIPTGFKTFDDRNGGMLRGALFVIGGTSGGGKSIAANQLGLNVAEQGYSSLIVPLEMTSREMFSRAISTTSGLNSLDVTLQRLATGEQKLAYEKMMRLDRRIARRGGRYTIFKPKEDVSISELLPACHSYNPDVLIIDYVGLLKDADDDEQWKKLGQIARVAKVYAENHNKVVVLLCQVSDEGKIRYSQAIKEHASMAWIFVVTKQSRERGFLNISQLKSRNQDDFPFTLKIDYSRTRVSDLTPEELKQLEATDKKAAKGVRGPGEEQTDDVLPDVTLDQ